MLVAAEVLGPADTNESDVSPLTVRPIGLLIVVVNSFIFTLRRYITNIDCVFCIPQHLLFSMTR